jgi:hypothetical protein
VTKSVAEKMSKTMTSSPTKRQKKIARRTKAEQETDLLK